MKVTTSLVLAGALGAAVLGCKSKQEEPDRAAPVETDPAPAGSANVAAPTPSPAAGSGTATAPTQAGGSDAPYGACDITATGGIDFVSHVENLPGAVITDHWHTPETKAANEKLRADAAKRGEIYRVPEQPLAIICQDGPRGLYIRFDPTFSKNADIRPIAQEFPIVQTPEDKPGVMRAEVRMREGGVTVKRGALKVTKFEQGELAATFQLEIETFDEPPKKATLAGTFTYHCGDHPRCGMK